MAECGDADLLFQLMQYYYFEASAWSGEQIGRDGLYDYDRADAIAMLETGPERVRLLECDGGVVGFVLLDDLDLSSVGDASLRDCLDAFLPGAGHRVREVADLFVLPTWRRRGLAVETVRRLLVPGSGLWLIATFRDDLKAHAYWQRALPRLGLRYISLPDELDARFRLFALAAPLA